VGASSAEPPPSVVVIEALSHDGRGVGRVQGKTLFVSGALPGEEVSFRYVRRRARFDEAVATGVRRASPQRVEPRCVHFGVCGGCSLQHLDPAAQLAAKEQTVLAQLSAIGRTAPRAVFPPLASEPWGYRRRARLGVKYVAKKGAVLVGFREKNSAFLADLGRCEVLQPSVGERLPALRELIAQLSVCRQIPQVEVAAGDRGTALIFRHLADFDPADLGRLRSFAERHGLLVYLQPAGPESVHALWPREARLDYGLPEFGLTLEFLPFQFIQVNREVNRKLVTRVVELLDVQARDRLLDLFCGLGNFTLPLALRAEQVLGLEGDASLVAQAQHNARLNGLGNASFAVADLNEPSSVQGYLGGGFRKLLLDPPRTGAAAIVRGVGRSGVERLVYVSCEPATLARDAGELVHGQGFCLEGVGVVDMFPHTAHVETIAVFQREGP
jgi:23S rRNA (uracil1939-C5)-methyltransferase